MMKQTATIFLVIAASAALSSCGSKETSKRQVQNDASQPAIERSSSGSEMAGAAVQFAAADLFGQSQSSSQWIGRQPVVLNYWGTWCPPCRREIPDLAKLYEEYHLRGVEMIGLAVKDEPGDVGSYAMRAGMKWVMLMASEEALRAYDVVNGIPTTIFLDKDGREVTRFIGNRSYADFKPAFETILNGYQPEKQKLTSM